MRRLVYTLALGLVAACGSEESAGGDDGASGDSGGDGSGGGAIVYPDSFCDTSGCVKGECDPDASDPMVEDCNAWEIIGSFALQAAKIDENAQRGVPAPFTDKGDDDPCPGNWMRTPEGVQGDQCCQRVSEQGELPSFKLTGLSMSTPPVFGNQAVAGTNTDAIQQERYNWVMQLSSKEPGDVTITSGMGLNNKDGSYAFVDGPFELNGKTWNQNGAWDVHEIPAKLEKKEGGGYTLSYAGPLVPEKDGRTFELPMWGQNYDFIQLSLSMTGITMSIDIDEDMLCAGYISNSGKFDLVGKLTAYLKLDPLRDTVLYFSEDNTLPLCPLTAQVKSCDGDVSTWESSSN